MYTLAAATLALATSPARAQGAVDTLIFDAARSGGPYLGAIPDRTLHLASWAEVCFFEGAEAADVHGAGAATAGGLCAPGSPGFLIADSATPLRFADAVAHCWRNGMRLPTAGELALADDLAFPIGTAWMAPPTSFAGWASAGSGVGTVPIYNGSGALLSEAADVGSTHQAHCVL